jgi:hypothetical protein
MRAVVHVSHGVLELNYMWLPTAIGMNSLLKKEIEEALAGKLQGLPLDGPGLDKAHDIVVDFLVKKFPEVNGLERFLDGLKYLEPR